MDRVRLGRVLGRGARMAAQTAYEALDAASAPSPQGIAARNTATPSSAASHVSAASSRNRVVSRTGGMNSSERRESRFTPLRRASRAVSLEVTGSFFALFALSFGLGIWKQRGELRAGSHGALYVGLLSAVSLFFAYCSVSSFVRARRLK